jgi:hypothetical protein
MDNQQTNRAGGVDETEKTTERWRRTLLIPAVILLAAALYQVTLYRAVPANYARLGIPREKIPPTAFGEHIGLAVTLVAVGCILIIVSLRNK